MLGSTWGDPYFWKLPCRSYEGAQNAKGRLANSQIYRHKHVDIESWGSGLRLQGVYRKVYLKNKFKPTYEAPDSDAVKELNLGYICIYVYILYWGSRINYDICIHIDIPIMAT